MNKYISRLQFPSLRLILIAWMDCWEWNLTLSKRPKGHSLKKKEVNCERQKSKQNMDGDLRRTDIKYDR